MQQASENGARPGMGRALGSIVAAVLFTAALCQSNLGHADGGWHGGFAGLPHSFGGGIAVTGSIAGVTDAMAGGGCRVGMVFPSMSGVGLLS